MVRILGIDPGTATTGFGIIDVTKGENTMIDAGVITTPAKHPMDERLATIYDNMNELMKEFKPQIMSIEKLFFARNVTTAMTVSQARGVMLLAAHQHSLEIHEYTPLQIKMAVTGYGKAEKMQIQEMVRVLLKLKQIPKPDDCADALAAAVCHSSTLRSGVDGIITR